jgi:hypothetical protein
MKGMYIHISLNLPIHKINQVLQTKAKMMAFLLLTRMLSFVVGVVVATSEERFSQESYPGF